MATRRRQPLTVAAATLLGLWLVAGLFYALAHHAKVTADKVLTFMKDGDPQAMSPENRRKSLAELARLINNLPPDERRQVRLAGDWERWFNPMTEQEKSDFIEQTMPSGFKQMLASFEQLPEEKRRKTVEDALRDLRRARDAMPETPGADPSLAGGNSTNAGPILSEELQRKIIGIGLNSFYRDSSAQTKAELAPVLEEMQRSMEGGALFRHSRR